MLIRKIAAVMAVAFGAFSATAGTLDSDVAVELSAPYNAQDQHAAAQSGLLNGSTLRLVLVAGGYAGPMCTRCRNRCVDQRAQAQRACCTNNGGRPGPGSCDGANRSAYAQCLARVSNAEGQCKAQCQPSCDRGS